MVKWSKQPSAPAPGTAICRLAALPEVGGREFIFQRQEKPFRLVVFQYFGKVFAYVNGCKHFSGTPLNPNNIGNFLDHDNPALIRCGVHGALFRVETGECIRGDCKGEFLDTVPVYGRDGQLFVGENSL